MENLHVLKMRSLNYILVLLLLAFAGCRGNGTNDREGSQLTFEPEILSDFNPDEWVFKTIRDELAPGYGIDYNLLFRQKPTLFLSGGGKNHAYGLWTRTKDITPERHYYFKAFFRAENIEQPWRSVLAHLIWLDENDRQIGVAEFPPTLNDQSASGWNIIGNLYQAPASARRARLELVYRWDGKGEVHFGDVSFNMADENQPRPVRLATVFHRPRNSRDSQDNREQYAELVVQAAASKADIICLPEGVTLAGTSHNYHSASEPVPGPSTEYFGKVARENNIYIVAGILEKDGDVVYNTAILIDREGSLAGKYRKVALPREEIDGGVTPGEDLPVFDTDFGRIGMMICWDVSFPEVARTLAMRGAEVILMPIWGGNLTLTRARSIENQVYLVTSTFDMVSAVFDPEGEMLDEATRDNPVIVTEVDLNRRVLWPWLGDFRNRIPREVPSKNATEWY